MVALWTFFCLVGFLTVPYINCNKKGKPVIIAKCQLWKIVNYHDAPLILNSSATGTPPLRYEWRMDGKKIPHHDLDPKMVTDQPTLRLHNVMIKDNGIRTFQCIVSNKYGAVNCDINVIVNVGQTTSPILTDSLPRSITAKPGDNVVLESLILLAVASPTTWCIKHDKIPRGYPTQKPAPHIWSSAKPYITTQGTGIAYDRYISIGILRNITDKDFGLYECFTSSGNGNASTYTLVTKSPSKSIQGQKPVFANRDNEKVVVIWREGGILNTLPLQCIASGEEPLTYKWYKDDKLTSVNSPEYSVANLQPCDNGKYKCEVSNKHGAINHTYTVYVPGTSKPKILPGYPKDAIAKMGGNHTMKCLSNITYGGYFSRWLKWNGNPTSKNVDLSSSDRIVLNVLTSNYKVVIKSAGHHMISTLHILNVNTNHFGLYTCCVENEQGASCGSAFLKQASSSNDVYQ